MCFDKCAGSCVEDDDEQLAQQQGWDSDDYLDELYETDE